MYWISFGIFGGTVSTPVDTSTIWTDGVSTFRLDVRSSNLFLDETKTALGFSGFLGLDWGLVWMKNLL